LTTPVIVIVIVVIPVTHPLVVLTVSHVSPFIPALKLCSCLANPIRRGTRQSAPNPDAVRIHVIDFATIAFSKDAFPNRPRSSAYRTKSFSLPKPA
jgi:hypothetical protein